MKKNLMVKLIFVTLLFICYLISASWTIVTSSESEYGAAITGACMIWLLFYATIFIGFLFLIALYETYRPTQESWNARKKRRPAILVSFLVAWFILLINFLIGLSIPQQESRSFDIFALGIGSLAIFVWFGIYQAMYNETDWRMCRTQTLLSRPPKNPDERKIKEMT